MPKKKLTPWDIRIRAQKLDHSEHAYINVEPELDLESFDGPLAEALTARRWLAGILGRLAAELADEIATSRRDHHCHMWGNQDGPDRCDLATGGLVDPWTDDLAPWLEFSVPKGERAAWKSRVGNLLAEILTAEAHQPTRADELAWAGPAVVQHQQTPAPMLPKVNEEAK